MPEYKLFGASVWEGEPAENKVTEENSLLKEPAIAEFSRGVWEYNKLPGRERKVIRDTVLTGILSNPEAGYEIIRRYAGYAQELSPSAQTAQTIFRDMFFHMDRFSKGKRSAAWNNPLKEGEAIPQLSPFLGYLEASEDPAVETQIGAIVDTVAAEQILKLIKPERIETEPFQLAALAEYLADIAQYGLDSTSPAVKRYVAQFMAMHRGVGLPAELQTGKKMIDPQSLTNRELLRQLLQIAIPSLYGLYGEANPEVVKTVDDTFRSAYLLWRQHGDPQWEIRKIVEGIQTIVKGEYDGPSGEGTEPDDMSRRYFHQRYDGQSYVTPYVSPYSERAHERAAGAQPFPFNVIWQYRPERDIYEAHAGMHYTPRGEDYNMVALPDGTFRVFAFDTTRNLPERELMERQLREYGAGEITRPEVVQSVLRYMRPVPFGEEEVRNSLVLFNKAQDELPLSRNESFYRGVYSSRFAGTRQVPHRLLHFQGDFVRIDKTLQEQLPFDTFTYKYAGKPGLFRVEMGIGENTVVCYMDNQFDIFLDAEQTMPFGIDQYSVLWWRGIFAGYLHGILAEPRKVHGRGTGSASSGEGRYRKPQGPYLRPLIPGARPSTDQIELARDYYGHAGIEFDLLSYSDDLVKNGGLPVTFVAPQQKMVYIPPAGDKGAKPEIEIEEVIPEPVEHSAPLVKRVLLSKKDDCSDL